MPYQLSIVDAFTNRKFGGNPAAVCIVTDERESDWMQAVAAEMNLSETAFVQPHGDEFKLRWFTPTAEVALCGHATLATAHILWESKILAPGVPATFETLSGKLTAVKAAAWINLDFPALDVEPTEPPEKLSDIVGVKPIFVGRSRFDYFLEVAAEKEVKGAAPDFTALGKLEAVRGVILTARSTEVEYDFVSRFFAPAVGVNEDPVTGSAHCCLAPYWSRKIGRAELVGYQASKRGGIVRVSHQSNGRVQLSGQAVTVTSGVLH